MKNFEAFEEVEARDTYKWFWGYYPEPIDELELAGEVEADRIEREEWRIYEVRLQEM